MSETAKPADIPQAVWDNAERLLIMSDWPRLSRADMDNAQPVVARAIKETKAAAATLIYDLSETLNGMTSDDAQEVKAARELVAMARAYLSYTKEAQP